MPSQHVYKPVLPGVVGMEVANHYSGRVFLENSEHYYMLMEVLSTMWIGLVV